MKLAGWCGNDCRMGRTEHTWLTYSVHIDGKDRTHMAYSIHVELFYILVNEFDASFPSII